jgi:hypothetical protein
MTSIIGGHCHIDIRVYVWVIPVSGYRQRWRRFEPEKKEIGVSTRNSKDLIYH